MNGAGWVSEAVWDAVAGAEAARDPDDDEARLGGRMLPRPGTGRERWSVRGHVGVMRIGREGDGDSQGDGGAGRGGVRGYSRGKVEHISV